MSYETNSKRFTNQKVINISLREKNLVLSTIFFRNMVILLLSILAFNYFVNNNQIKTLLTSFKPSFHGKK